MLLRRRIIVVVSSDSIIGFQTVDIVRFSYPGIPQKKHVVRYLAPSDFKNEYTFPTYKKVLTYHDYTKFMASSVRFPYPGIPQNMQKKHVHVARYLVPLDFKNEYTFPTYKQVLTYHDYTKFMALSVRFLYIGIP